MNNTIPTKYLVFDFEANEDWGLHIWHPQYTLTSCEFLFVDGDKRRFIFSTDIAEIKKLLKFAIKDGYILIVYNYSYEYAVLSHVLKIEPPHNQVLDALRLYGLATKRAGKAAKRSLIAAVEEFFKVKDFKDEFHQKVIELGLAKNKAEAKGAVGNLPPDILEEYNKADVEWTEKVFLESYDRLIGFGVDISFDSNFYNRKVIRNVKAWLHGVKVDREEAAANLASLKEEYDGYIEQFKEKYALEIAEAVRLIKESKLEKDYQARYNKAKNKDKIKRKEDVKFEFNLGSTDQLTVLFLDVFKLRAKVFTKGGAPSFGRKFMGQWGEHGELISKWKSLVKPISELESVLEQSEVDGRVHFYINPYGTVTGRGSSSF